MTGLACAAMIGDRAVACVSACTLAPFGAEGLDWAAGMGEMNAEQIEIAARGYDALYAHLQPVGEQLAVATPRRCVPVSHGRWLAEHIPSADAMIFEDEGHISLQERHTGAMLEWLAEQVVMVPG